MPYKIQQLGLGGVLDQTFAIVKDHFGLLFKIVLFMMVPWWLIAGYLNASLLPTMTTFFPSAEQQAETNAAMLKYWPLFFLSGVVGLIIMPVTNAALVQAAAHLYLGREITAGKCIKDGFKLLVPYVLTAILAYLAIFAGLILLIIPGLIVAIWLSFTQYVVVIEGTSGPAALGRSRSLVRGHMGAVFAFGFVMYVISILIGFCPNFIPEIHVRVLVATVVQAALTIVWIVGGVVLYFSCRCANENFDLHYLAQAISDTPAAGNSATGNP